MWQLSDSAIYIWDTKNNYTSISNNTFLYYSCIQTGLAEPIAIHQHALLKYPNIWSYEYGWAECQFYSKICSKSMSI